MRDAASEPWGAEKNFAKWGELNMCTGDATAAEPTGCETFSTCGDGSTTVLCTVGNGSHCGSYRSFMIPEIAWRILKDKSLN